MPSSIGYTCQGIEVDSEDLEIADNILSIKVSVTEIFDKILNFSFLSPFDEIKGEFSNGEFFMFVLCREVYLFWIKYYFYFFVN